MFEPAIVIVVVILVVVVVSIAIITERRRQKMWLAVANRYGFAYSKKDPYGIPKQFERFALFQRGHSRIASHCLEGDSDGTHVLVFDYRYTTGSGKNQSTHRLSALLARTAINCPYLMIRPESFFDRIGDFLGFDDIDFEYDEFNRKFHVKGDNKQFAYDICHSAMMDFLLKHQQLTWELSGNHLLLYGLGKFDPKEIDYCLRVSADFLNLFPAYLRQKGVE